MKKQMSCVLMGMALAMPVFAADQFGTEKEAEALVKKAIKHVASVGKDKAYSDFSTSAWVDRDLYLVALDPSGKVVAHGTNPKLLGKDFSNVKDVDGVPFTAQMVEVAKTKGKGWVNFKFTDPVTKKVAPKSSYCEKSDQDAICAGIYKR